VPKSKRGGQSNALKHGAFSRIAVLPGEKPSELEKLRQQVFAEWQPNGATEEDAASEVARALWMKARYENYARQKIAQMVDLSSREYLAAELLTEKTEPFYESINSRGLSLDPARMLERDEIGKKREKRKALGYVFREDAVANLLGFSSHLYGDQSEAALEFSVGMLPEFYRNHLEQKVRAEQFNSTRDWVFAMKREVDKVLLPLARKALKETLPPPVPAQDLLRDPEEDLAEIAIRERINLMLDKAIKRLVQAKAFKQMMPDNEG